jgi:uncharacterized protein
MASGAERQDKADQKRYSARMNLHFTHLLLIPLRRLIPVICVALLACAAPQRYQTPPPAPDPLARTGTGPTLWIARDTDTEIIFFGTIHLLPAGLDWQRPELKAAIDKARLVYLESDTRSLSPAEERAFAQAARARPGADLTDLLTPEAYASLSSAMSALNSDMRILKGAQPWYAAIVLGRLSLEHEGYLTRHGAEAWLREQAEQRDIPLRTLEQAPDVARALSGLPDAIQVSLLLSAISDTKTVKTAYPDILRVWLAGDPDGLHAVTLSDMQRDLPEVYSVMLEDRNRAWLTEIERIMTEETGTVLVAVGAGHLTGPVSLTELLRAKGWVIERS